MVEFGTSTLVQYFMHILAKFNTFSRSLWPNVAEFNSTLFQYLCGQMWPNSIQHFFNIFVAKCGRIQFNTFSISLWPNVAEFNSILFQYRVGTLFLAGSLGQAALTLDVITLLV